MKIPNRKGQPAPHYAADIFRATAEALRSAGLPLDAEYLTSLGIDYKERTEDGGLVCSALDSLPIYRGPR